MERTIFLALVPPHQYQLYSSDGGGQWWWRAAIFSVAVMVAQL